MKTSRTYSHSYPQLSNQEGIGLVEIMVALLLLAVAVLGFTAMQMTAVKATDESLIRTRALTVMRGGAEMMRANPDGIAAFKDAINGTASSVLGVTKNDCMPGAQVPTCSINQLASRDALTVKAHAADNDMKIAMVTCPGTETGQARQCFVSSWGTTEPKLDGSATACATSTGTYISGAQCFVMEAY